MKVLPVSDSAIKEAVTTIKNGGVIAHATETCYGFACDLTNANVVKRLPALKCRSEDQPVSALFPSVDEAKKWVKWNAKAEEIAQMYLPGPLTIVLPVKNSDASNSETLGVRISSHPIAQKLAKLAGVPLSTTSANLHGGPNPYSAEDIVTQFADRELQPDLILDSGELSVTKPSTVISIQNGKMTVLREGEVSI